MLSHELSPETTTLWIPIEVRTTTPPQLLAFARPVVVQPESIVVPAEAPPRVYVPPYFQRKQDRN
jgi:hypothetical protein